MFFPYLLLTLTLTIVVYTIANKVMANHLWYITLGQAPTTAYGAVGPAHAEVVLEKAEFQAKRRVLFFLLAFIVSGFFSECVYT